MIRSAVVSLAFCLFFAASAFAERPALVAEQSAFSVQAGTAAWLPVDIVIPAGAYVYGNPKGPGTGKALELDITFPDGINYGKARITPPMVYRPQNDEYVNIYRNSVTLFLPVTAGTKGTFSASATITGLMCTDRACTPFVLQKTLLISASDKTTDPALSSPPAGTVEFGASLNLHSSPSPSIKPAAASAPAFTPRFLSHSVNGILSALLFGFLAGLLLNIMPCVLPVLALKVAGVVKHAHDRRKTAEGGLLYAAGIMSFFILISTLVVLAGYRWGAFFQSSSFLIVVILVLFSFALSLLGVYSLQTPAFTAKPVMSGKSFMLDSFTKGFLAALLATPCSGPFLGSVLAWSLTRSGAEKSAVFLSIGVGLAFPYLLVTVFPSLVRFIPKPGKWTIVFEKIMGVLLLLSAVYFTLILDRSYYLSVSAMVLVSTVALWQFGRFGSPLHSVISRRVSFLFLVLLLAAALAFPFSVRKSVSPHADSSFSIESVRSASLSGRISVVVFTADWCPNCKLVEKTVLESDKVAELLQKEKIALFYADITEKGTAGEELLTRLGGTAIPFLAVFPAGEKFTSPVCLRDIYTVHDFEEAVRAAAE